MHIERFPAGRFNFSSLLERQGGAPPDSTEDTEPTRFSLNNVEISNGQIEIIDRSLTEPARHVIGNLDLAIPFVGNLPYLEDRYVQPLLRATVDGSPFELKGELKPFADTQEYSCKLKLDALNLVITSYSIHYTKLYETPAVCSPSRNVVSSMIICRSVISI